ncbi:MAG: hypothetical protein ACQKBV_03995 [Puniceicoccales bacterium]
MKGLSIALRVLAILGAAAAVAAWVMTKGKVEEAEQKFAQSQGQVQSAQSQVSELEGQITTARGEANRLSEELADTKARVTFHQKESIEQKREVSKLESAQKELQAKFKELQAANDQLKRELIDRDTNRPTTATADSGRVQELEDKIATLQTELANANDKLSAANMRARAASGSDTASTVMPTGFPSSSTTTTAASGSTAPAPAATVAQLNAKSASILRSDHERGILIISRGQVDGLQKQMEFNVAKGLEKTVRVKVGSVAPTYSVAYVLPGEDPSHLQEGDQVSINR